MDLNYYLKIVNSIKILNSAYVQIRTQELIPTKSQNMIVLSSTLSNYTSNNMNIAFANYFPIYDHNPNLDPPNGLK